MPIEISEDVLENDEFSMITDSNGDLVLEHKPTGGQFKFDSANNAWTPVQGLAMGGADIASAGNVDVGQSLVTQDLTVQGTATGTSTAQGCRVFLSSQQSISSGVPTKIQFDSKEYDSQTDFDTNSHNWTCPEDGLYMANLQVEFRAGGNGDERRVLIGSDSSAKLSGEGTGVRVQDSDSLTRINTATLNKYSSGDKIAGYAINDSSSDTLGAGDGGFRTLFEVAFLGGL
jgi:hypothetical protein